MPLYEEFEKQGNWLFVRRSWFPLLFFPLFFAALLNYRTDIILYGANISILFEIKCVAISFIGLLIRAVAIGYAPAGTSGRNTSEGQIAEKLNTKGIYSIVRHPLYLGNFLIFFGFVLFTQSVWFNILAVLGYWLYYERIMLAEEEFLRKKYGLEYENWASGVPAFIPHLRGWIRPELSFSFKNVLKREYTALFEICLAFPVLELLGRFLATGRMSLNFFWLVFLAFGVVTYIILRTLKKRTKLLDVEGR